MFVVTISEMECNSPFTDIHYEYVFSTQEFANEYITEYLTKNNDIVWKKVEDHPSYWFGIDRESNVEVSIWSEPLKLNFIK